MSDAFEQLVADLFWAEGYWVRTGIKVELTPDEKRRIGLPSCPRWEIDLVAYKPATGELLAIECKSYLDSRGVNAADFEPGAKLKGRYKLFHDPVLRETVLSRLAMHLVETGLCAPGASPKLCLAFGKATRGAPEKLAPLFAANGWTLFGMDWIQARLGKLATAGYENSTASMVAKLMARMPAPGAPPAPFQAPRRAKAPAMPLAHRGTS